MKQQIITEFQERSYSDIDDKAMLLGIEKCYEKKKFAYSPYSNFSVIASVVYPDDEIVFATNQENIAFPSGICAEANVLSYCGSNLKGKSIECIVIVAFDQNFDEVEFISPCGKCRQIMIESENRQESNIKVCFGSKKTGFYLFNSCHDLLPLFFSSNSTKLI
jgi:cytidine deaminase